MEPVIIIMTCWTKKRLSEAEKWYFRLMNDPEQFEKEGFIDHINELNFIIKDY
jgi:hypothetical protein